MVDSISRASSPVAPKLDIKPKEEKVQQASRNEESRDEEKVSSDEREGSRKLVEA